MDAISVITAFTAGTENNTKFALTTSIGATHVTHSKAVKVSCRK
jgi:hypothetical protein